MRNKGLKKKAMASALAVATVMNTSMFGLVAPVFATGEKLNIDSVDVKPIDLTASYVDNTHDTKGKWATDRVKITVNASTNGDAYFTDASYSFDGGTTWQKDNYKEYTSNANVEIKLKASNGQITEYDETIVIDNIDNTAPIVVGTTSVPTEWTSEARIEVDVYDEGSGVNAYSFDNGLTWQKNNFKDFYENVSDLYVIVKDAAGNMSDPNYIGDIDKIDRTAPNIISIEGNPTEYQREKSVELVVNAEDKDSGELKYSFNGGEWTDSNVSPAFAENQTVNVQVKDYVGNIASRDVVIDKIDDVYALISQESEVWDAETNKSTVTVRSSNKELAENDEWKHPKLPGNTIQKDMYALVKVYDANNTYKDVEFTDNHGFSSKLNIVVKKIDDIAPEVGIEQIENEDGTVTVRVEADEDLDLTNTNDEFEYVDPEDKTIIEATYDRNIDLGEVIFSDIYGNETTEAIDVTGCKFVVLINEVDSGIEGISLIKASSVLPLKDIKPTWTFTDENNMEKLYYKNGTYTTTFTNEYDETYDTTFEVKNANFTAEIDDITYSDDMDNEVTVTVTSTHEFANTKPTWTLSEDKHTYTKKFKANADYLTTFEDVYGEKDEIRILVTEVDEMGPDIHIQIVDATDEYGAVGVMAISDEELADTKPTWDLEDYKRIYYKVYSKNGTYTTTFTDKHGNTTEKTFTIKNCSFKLIQDADYDPVSNTITVKVYSYTPLKDTKPTWTMSCAEYGFAYIYEKTFPADSENYYTTFESVDGERQTILIDFSNVDR